MSTVSEFSECPWIHRLCLHSYLTDDVVTSTVSNILLMHPIGNNVIDIPFCPGTLQSDLDVVSSLLLLMCFAVWEAALGET